MKFNFKPRNLWRNRACCLLPQRPGNKCRRSAGGNSKTDLDHSSRTHPLGQACARAMPRVSVSCPDNILHKAHAASHAPAQLVFLLAYPMPWPRRTESNGTQRISKSLACQARPCPRLRIRPPVPAAGSRPAPTGNRAVARSRRRGCGGRGPCHAVEICWQFSHTGAPADSAVACWCATF